MSDNATISIPRPKCGHKNPKSIRWIETHDQFVCAGCSAKVAVEAEKLLAGIEGVRKGLAGFRKKLRKLGK